MRASEQDRPDVAERRDAWRSVQKGLDGHARLVMVLHPLLESRFYGAVHLVSRMAFVRSEPRAIRVIEEEFVD